MNKINGKKKKIIWNIQEKLLLYIQWFAGISACLIRGSISSHNMEFVNRKTVDRSHLNVDHARSLSHAQPNIGGRD